MSKNAIKGSESIYGCDAEFYSKHIIDSLHNKLNINATCLGSTGKKKDTDMSGDIDIAIEMEFTTENVERIKSYLEDEYGKDVQIYISYGFKIVSFGLKYNTLVKDETEKEKYAQVDLMFSNDLAYSKFMYHSPNYKNNESKFKGLYRTNLLIFIAGRTPHGVKDVYDEEGNLMDFWKYSLTYDRGLVLTHKTHRGKKKRLKNPVTVKEDTELILKDPEKIVKFILGPDATIADTNSFESLSEYMFSDKYPNKDIIPDILNDYFSDERQHPMINEIMTHFIKIIKSDADKLAVFCKVIPCDNEISNITEFNYDNI